MCALDRLRLPCLRSLRLTSVNAFGYRVRVQDVQALEFGFDLPKPPGKVARLLALKRRLDLVFEEHGPVYPSSMVAKALGISRQRICQLVDKGMLVQVKVDHHAFITETSLRAWVAEERKGGRPPKELTLSECWRAGKEILAEQTPAN